MYNYIGSGFRINVIENNYIDPYETQTVTFNRSWRERLFSLPWKPLQKTIEIKVYDYTKPIFYKVGNDTIVCHSSVVNMLTELLKDINSSVPLKNKNRIL